MTKIQLVTRDCPPPQSTPSPTVLRCHGNPRQPSAKIYCWPSFFSPSDEPELLLLPLPLLLLSRSAAIFL